MGLKEDMAAKAAAELETKENIQDDGRGRPPVDEKMKTYGYAMRPSEYEDIKRIVESEGDNMSAFVRRAVIQAARDLKRPRR